MTAPRRTSPILFWLLMAAAPCLPPDASAAGAYDYAAWAAADPDGSWTAIAERAVEATRLPDLAPAGMAEFCPGYEGGEPTGRTRFWVGLMSAMARFESAFDPKRDFVEPRVKDGAGRAVTSRGLLQLSIESANQPRYACGIEDATDLHDPEVNLGCAARVLSYWVEQDGVLASAASPHRGGARYWSVLRHDAPYRAAIASFTRQLPVCRAP